MEAAGSGAAASSRTSFSVAGRVLALSLGLAWALGGCATPPKAEVHPFHKNQSMVTEASKRMTIVKVDRSPLWVCSEPFPDVKIDESLSTDFDLNLAFVVRREGTDAGEKSGFTEGELEGRTPAVLITRELMFRLCEMGMNVNADKATMVELFKKTLGVIKEIAVSEGKNTRINIGQTLKAEESDKTSFEVKEQETDRFGGAAGVVVAPKRRGQGAAEQPAEETAEKKADEGTTEDSSSDQDTEEKSEDESAGDEEKEETTEGEDSGDSESTQ